jgi:antitoxin component YwqK of YwqJK toxin-antitoxin module
MNKFACLFILIFSFSFAQSQEKTNQLDENGKKNGLWRGFFQESKKPKYEGIFEHGIEIGIFKFFDDTKAKSIMATRSFSENGTVSYTVFYDQNKNIVSEGKTVNRLNEGEWKYYHEASKDIKMIELYLNGKLSGVKKLFYRNGNLAQESIYLNDKKNGISKIYTEKGVVMEEAFFKNGQYDGLAIFKETNGNLASKGMFVNGVKKGKWQFYENGKFKQELVLPIVKYLAKPKKRQI